VSKFVFLFCCAIICNTSLAQIYKWTDSNGDVHFSDKPHPGAEQIQLPNSQTYSPPLKAEVPVSTEPPPPAANTDNQPYNSVVIIQPEDQATIRNNQGYLSVIVQLDPELRPGDKIQMILDGEPIGAPQATPVFALRDINRGSHTVAVKILSSEGKELNSSNTVTVFMHQPQVGMVPETRKRNVTP
jgi:hypothetical protein